MIIKSENNNSIILASLHKSIHIFHINIFFIKNSKDPGKSARIVQTIKDDERRALTLTSLTREIDWLQGISLSLPRILGRSGVLAELQPVLSDREHEALEKSAALLRNAVTEIGY